MAWSPDSEWLISGSDDTTVRRWNATTGEPDWVAIQLPNDASATFSRAGQLLYGDKDVVEKDFVYLIEQDDGSLNLLKHSEFLRLKEIAKPPSNAGDQDKPKK